MLRAWTSWKQMELLGMAPQTSYAYSSCILLSLDMYNKKKRYTYNTW